MKKNSKQVRVLFISPLVKNNEKTPPHFPLGIAYLAAYLRLKGIYVKAVDFNVDNKEDEIVGIANKFHYVGISAFATAQINHGYYLAQKIKMNCPNIILVFGGYHTTFLPEEAFRIGFADYVIKGHGEIPLYELIKGKNKRDIIGLSYFENGKFVHNPINSEINLSKLPFPALDLFKLRKYQNDVHVMPYAKHTAIDIKSSMGCLNFCSYCSAPLIYKGKIFYKTSRKMFNEVMYYIKKFKIHYFHFEDENWLIDRDRIEKFCDLINKNKINIKYAFMSSINILYKNIDLINKLKKSGCVCIDLGLETADKDVQEEIGKSNSLKQLIELDSVLKDNNIYPFILIMTFNIGETLDSLANTTKAMLQLKKTDIETIEYLKTNSSPYGFGQFATPHIGTPFYEKAKKFGLFLSDKNYDLHVWTRPSFIPNSFLNDIPQVIKDFSTKNNLNKFLDSFKKDILRYFDRDYLDIFWQLYKIINNKNSIMTLYSKYLKNYDLSRVCLCYGMMAKFFIICSKK